MKLFKISGAVLTLLVVIVVITSTFKVQAPKAYSIDTRTIVTTLVSTTKQEITESTIDEDEVEMLAHLLNGEAGASWCTDEMIYCVGSVVLNRVNSEHFPDTLEGVIFQPGQYACTWDGNYDREPSQRCYDIAEDLLLNGSILPANVVYQAEFEQGAGTYKQIQNLYFCYL